MAKAKLTDQKYEKILAHVLSPEESPLPVELQAQFDRLVQASRLLDRHPDTAQIVAKLQAKFNIGRNTAYQDIRFARELFVYQNDVHFDFLKAWQIKDILELIRECKQKNNLKEWRNAHETLTRALGERPEMPEDPRRLGKNNIYIQLNVNGKTYNLSPETLSIIGKKGIHELSEAVYATEITENDAEKIMNS